MSKNKHHKRKKTKRKGVLQILALFLICLLCFAVVRAQKTMDSDTVIEAGSSIHADHSGEYIEYQGQKYPIIRRLSTVLLIGTDNFEEDAAQIDESANRNHNQSDFLVILLFDHDQKTVTPFQFNRDTVCDIPWLDENGKTGGFHTEHLAFAHTYGTGKSDSCLNTVAAIRKLIFNAPIDHYFAFTMDAVPLMNDLVGGVSIRLTESIPDLGAEYTRGAKIHLNGASALRFLRYREHRGGSNLLRMKRHIQYLNAFTLAAREAVKENQDLAVDAFKLIDPFLCTDLTVNNISEMVNWLCEYEIKKSISPSADVIPGEEYYEAYLHEDSLWSCVYEAYCRKS